MGGGAVPEQQFPFVAPYSRYSGRGRGSSRVSIVSADISDEEQARALLAQIRRESGGVRGIIHSAGVGVGERGLLLSEETEAGLRRMLAPKVEGTELLDRLTELDELDFFLSYAHQPSR